VEAVEDVHQRRLAGAVLAEQRVHLARRELEVDVVVRDDAGKPLRHSAQLEDGRLARHSGDPNGVGGRAGPSGPALHTTFSYRLDGSLSFPEMIFARYW